MDADLSGEKISIEKYCGKTGDLFNPDIVCIVDLQVVHTVHSFEVSRREDVAM